MSAAEDGEVTLVVRFEASPGQEGELEARLRRMVSASTAEDGCLQYTLHADRDGAAHFVLYERWTSWAALAAHDQTSHVKDFVAVLPDLLVEDFGRWQLRRLTALG